MQVLTIIVSIGSYMYIESSSPRKMNDTAVLMSPMIKSTKTCTMRLYYHMYGDHIGTLNIYRMVGKVKSLLWTQSGGQGRKWIRKEIDLTASSNGFYVCFVFTSLHDTIVV